jgi:uncharacterized membrane protein HdeD (DUF308 family)
MDNKLLVVIAGAMMLAGGLVQLVSLMRRRGRGPWRGPVVSAVAVVAYGVLALSGHVLNGTTLSAVLIWFIAAAIWIGFWLTRRDAARQVQ